MKTTLFGCFERVVAAQPDRIAIREATRTWTYAQLLVRANAIAAHLDQHGAGDRVACLLSHGGEMVAAILGVLAGGRAYVTLDPTHPADRSTFVLADSGATALLHDAAQSTTAVRLAGGVPLVRTDEAVEGRVPARRPGPDSLAYCLYTSGSTGRPKGVPQVHANVLYFIDAYCRCLEIEPTDSLSLLSTFAFDAAVVDVFSALLSGATLCPYDMRDAGLVGLSAMLADRGVTIYHSTPTVFRELAQMEPRLSLLIRAVVLGGEEVRADDVAQFRAVCAPDAVLVNGYGMTECSWALLNVVRPGDESTRATVPIGVPIDGVRITLVPVDDESAPDDVGTIVIECAHVAGRYWKRPDETAAAFPGPGTYVTTDFGRRLPDGRFEFAGRKASHVKLRGYRIDLREIEAVILTHPGVREAVVDLRATLRGDELIAYVAGPPGHEPPDIVALRAHLSAKLPGHMLPATAVRMAALPRGATNKIDRRALPAPPPPRRAATSDFIGPGTPLELQLADIWRDLLHVERVSLFDDFFALGGQSLLAIRLLVGIERRLGVTIPLRELFVDATLGGLAARIEQALLSGRAVERPTLNPTATRRARLPAALRGVFKLNKMMSSDRFARHVWSAWIDGPVDVRSLERAVDAMRARHALLRTRFFDDHEREMLEVLDPADVERFGLLESTDLSSLSEAEQEQADADFHQSVSFRPLDLSHGEVMSVALSRWSAARHRLTVSLHNIVSDAESLTIYVNELCELWRAFAAAPERDPVTILPPAHIQYHHLADYLERVRDSEMGRTQRAFWKSRLEGFQALELPIDSPRDEVDARREANAGIVAFRSGSVEHTLSNETLIAIEETAERQRATVMSTLVAAMAGYLSERTSQQDLAFITRLSHRYIPGLERTLGFLVNPIVLRISTVGATTYSELVERTHAVVTDAFDHGECDIFEIAPYSAFRLCLVYTRATPGSELPLPDGITATQAPHPGASGGSQIGYDLLLWLKHHGDRVTLYLAYNLELFRDTTAAAFLEGYLQYVTAACCT